MARPRKYATAAERQAAYRDRYALIEIRLPAKVAETLTRLSEEVGYSRNEVIYNLIVWSLTNKPGGWREASYNWRLPGSRERNPDELREEMMREDIKTMSTNSGRRGTLRNPYRVEVKAPKPGAVWEEVESYPSESEAASYARALAVARPYDAVRVIRVET